MINSNPVRATSIDYNQLVPRGKLSGYFYKKYLAYLQERFAWFYDHVERSTPERCWSFYGSKELSLMNINDERFLLECRTLLFVWPTLSTLST